MTIPCLAISLPGQSKRQQNVTELFGRYDQPVELVYGVEGSRLAQAEYYESLRDEFREYLPDRYEQLGILPGEAGCYLSFIRALRRAYETGAESALIVEDDVEFRFDDFAVLEGLTQTDLHWDQIKLTYTEYPLSRGIWIGDRQVLGQRFDFYFYWRGIICNTCNIYSRAGIRKLLDHCPRFGMIKPFDALISTRRYFMDFVPVFVRPTLACENIELESSIVPGRGNRSALDYYRRKEGFGQRKLRQLRHIAADLRHPLRSLLFWLRKSRFLWYCCKYLLWARKKPKGAL